MLCGEISIDGMAECVEPHGGKTRRVSGEAYPPNVGRMKDCEDGAREMQETMLGSQRLTTEEQRWDSW